MYKKEKNVGARLRPCPNNKGITLIALIITIIIMLILVAVTISMAVNGGLFEYAGKAVGEMQNAVDVEQQLANGRIQIGGVWYDSIDDYIKGNPSEGEEDNQRKINVEYTQSEGEDLWSSTVTLNISFEEDIMTFEKKKEKAIKNFDCANYEEFKVVVENLATEIYGVNLTYDQLVAQQGEEEILDIALDLIALEQKKELVAYMTDFPTYEDFKAGIEYMVGVTYEEALTNYGYNNEEEFLTMVINSMKNTLSYKDIEKLEGLGVKVICVKTPYDTIIYTSSLGGNVKCTFVENGTYTFSIESGEIKTQQTVKIDNIRNYDDQVPHDIKIDFINKTTNSVQYSIDDSTEKLEESGTFECNDSITLDLLYVSSYKQYTFLNKDFYKYFYSSEEMETWFGGNVNVPYVLGVMAGYYNITVRQFLFMNVMENPLTFNESVGEHYYKIVDCAQQIADSIAKGEIAGDYPINIQHTIPYFPEELLEKYPQFLLCHIEFPENGVFKFTKDTHLYIRFYECLTTDTYVEVVVWDEEKKKKIRIRKKLKDVTYEDELLVWDFDKGEFTTAKPLWIMKTKRASKYNLLKFSDGSELRTIDQHRIFNKEAGKFTYPMTDETPIGTTTYTAEGKKVKLVSKEVIVKEVEYTNIITKYHMNVFANNILTSCRFSNLYPIKDMKYVKDDRETVGKEEYANIPEEYYYGLRLGEQPKEANRGNDVEHAKTIEEHIQRVYIDNAKEK